MIVVDANVLAYFYLPGDYTSRAEALLERDSEWAVPVIWRSEFRSILTGYLRRKRLTQADAAGLQREAEDLLAGFEYEVDSATVFRLVAESACSSYDCEYVALAHTLGVKLVTNDRAVLRAFPHVAVPLV